MLVRAVLAPHRAEHRPLERVGFAADLLAHEDGLVFGEACVVWNLVRLRRFRRPQGWGRTHDRVIAPCDAIKESLADWITESYRAYSPAQEARSGGNGRNLRTSP